MGRKIKMQTNACGPHGNFRVNEVFAVPEVISTDIADEFVEGGYAIEVGTLDPVDEEQKDPEKVLTNAELVSALEAKGIEVPARANKTELQALLDQAED